MNRDTDQRPDPDELLRRYREEETKAQRANCGFSSAPRQAWARPTRPDRVFEEADKVVLVDLPPDELLQRLKEGKVYLPAQAERAIRNFFRKGNLIALRERPIASSCGRSGGRAMWRAIIICGSIWGISGKNRKTIPPVPATC